MAGRCSIQRGAAAAQSPAPAPRSESGIYNVPVEGWHWQLRAAPSSRMWSPLSCTLRARLPSLAACVRVRLIFAACPRPRQAAAKLMSLSDSAKRAPPRGLEKEAHRMHAASTQPARQSARGQHAASTRRHAEQRGPLAGVYSCGPVCAAHTPRGERPLVACALVLARCCSTPSLCPAFLPCVHPACVHLSSLPTALAAVAPENAALIGQSGIAPLVALLANGSTNAQSHAAGALANCR